eukprot:s3848_g3.t1
MIKGGWSEYQRTGKVRWQFLCIVLGKDTGTLDKYLLKELKLAADEVRQAIERDGEVFIIPIAVRSLSAHSSKGDGFKLDPNKIYRPLTTQLTYNFQYCYHVTEISNLMCIMKGGLQPGRHKGGCAHVFFNPFAPWDDRYESVLGGKLTHLGAIRVALVFSVHSLIGYGGMIMASGELVVGGNVPFWEVVGGWKLQDYLSDRDSRQSDDLREVQRFPHQLWALERELRLNVKPIHLVSLSLGKNHRRMQAQVQTMTSNMDKDEIDRLAKKPKRRMPQRRQRTSTWRKRQQMMVEAARPSRPSPTQRTAADEERDRREAEADREQAEEDAKEEAQEAAADPIPSWATRIVPGRTVHCNDAADNGDHVDSTARVIDNMIVTHLKVANADDEDKADVRREVTNFLRKVIAGTLAVKSYDYFRENKLKSSKRSEAQLEDSIRSSDPADRGDTWSSGQQTSEEWEVIRRGDLLRRHQRRWCRAMVASELHYTSDNVAEALRRLADVSDRQGLPMPEAAGEAGDLAARWQEVMEAAAVNPDLDAASLEQLRAIYNFIEAVVDACRELECLFGESPKV